MSDIILFLAEFFCRSWQIFTRQIRWPQIVWRIFGCDKNRRIPIYSSS